MNAIERGYRARTPRSAEHFRRAQRLLPGGTTRTPAAYPPYPLTFVRGEGPYLWDADGHRYIDLLSNYSSLIHGNCFPPVIEAITQAAALGSAWAGGAQGTLDLAEELLGRLPRAEHVRLCNSGTEAALLARRIATAVTGRHLLLRATGSYHGIEPIPTSTGTDTLYAAYNDTEAFARVLTAHKNNIAAVYLEPVQSAGGVITGDPAFLSNVAQLTRAAGALFVLDEVVTLRLHAHGLQAPLELSPDLTLLGKIIGGGLPIGAIAGSRELLSVLDPAHPHHLHHAGTFNGNPLATAAGTIALRHYQTAEIERLDQLGARLERGLRAAATAHGIPLTLRRAGSLLNVEPHSKLHLACLNHGVVIAPRGFMALSTAVSEKDIAEASERIHQAIGDLNGIQ
ncbi:glutamate-1-semialdehyde 2,1-aminomutase [Streptomyces sp. V4I8]|uniref:aspartate aminotransferase family protein n=1 Tax=Streptomyces sp. V4I8 TaxID=3156469 RepID=UPI003518009B